MGFTLQEASDLFKVGTTTIKAYRTIERDGTEEEKGALADGASIHQVYTRLRNRQAQAQRALDPSPRSPAAEPTPTDQPPAEPTASPTSPESPTSPTAEAVPASPAATPPVEPPPAATPPGEASPATAPHSAATAEVHRLQQQVQDQTGTIGSLQQRVKNLQRQLHEKGQSISQDHKAHQALQDTIAEQETAIQQAQAEKNRAIEQNQQKDQRLALLEQEKTAVGPRQGSVAGPSPTPQRTVIPGTNRPSH